MQVKGLRRAALSMAGAAAVLLSAAVQAAGVPGQGTWETTLKGRDISGNPVPASSSSAVFLYDATLNITWLRNANVNGTMNWSTAVSWANGVTVGAYSGWRLPTMIDTGSPGCNYSQSGGTDCGYNVQTKSGDPTKYEAGQTIYSEMAHLWYVTLGNKAYYAPGTGIGPQPGWGLTNTGTFENLQSYYYWYALEEPSGSEARDLNAEIGNQHHSMKSDLFYAMAVRPGDVLSTGFLGFPLQGLSPETALINAVLDHSGPPFTRNGSVSAFTGEIASCDFGLRIFDIKSGLSKVLTGTERELVCTTLKAGKGEKKKLYEYMTEGGKPASFPPFDVWFSYDGHSGYDYKAAKYDPILAAADGVLCVATPVTLPRADIHRDPSKCPYASDPINGQLNRKSGWDAFHTFYIMHPGSENLTTWYLHATDLSPSVAQSISTKGYADVSLGQEVANVGGCCIDLGPHLHFEVRKGDSESVDPYGWKGTPRLWR